MPPRVIGRRAILRLWRAFWSRRRPVWEFIEFNDEGFWPDLEEGRVAREVQSVLYTIAGAVVREFSVIRDAVVQAGLPTVSESATQTEIPAIDQEARAPAPTPVSEGTPKPAGTDGETTL